jgi:hypothetical protein
LRDEAFFKLKQIDLMLEPAYMRSTGTHGGYRSTATTPQSASTSCSSAPALMRGT